MNDNKNKNEHQRALARERQRRRRERLRKIREDMKIQIDRLSHEIKLEEMGKNEINELQQDEDITMPSIYIPECIYQVDKKLNEAEKKNHKLNIEKIEHQRALARERQRRRRERLSEMEKVVIKETDRLSHLIRFQKMNENERLVHREIKRLQQRKRREDIRANTYRLDAYPILKMFSDGEKKNHEMSKDKIERRRTLARERQRRRRERLKEIGRHMERENSANIAKSD